jgi:predicted HicB family RNase H-like nuclease
VSREPLYDSPDKINMLVDAKVKKAWQAKARALGKSLTAYIIEAVRVYAESQAGRVKHLEQK